MKQQSLLEKTSFSPWAASTSELLMNERIPYDAVETMLETFLEEELSDLELFDIKAISEASITAKWKYSSALQKSIRRGYVEDSIKYALAYHGLDPVGFWNRLVIIAFEDIGVGDVWAVAMTLAAARSTLWRKRVGGDLIVIQYIIKRLAESVKDRTVADLYQVLENRSLLPEPLARLKYASSQELSGIALSDQCPLETRVAATWLLWGTDKMRNPHLPLRTGSREWFDCTIESMKMPGLVKYVTLRGMVACRGCAMNISYTYAWEMMKKSAFTKMVETNLPVRYYIGGIPEEAWDMHTRQGKAAYLDFYKVCLPVSEFLTSRRMVSNDGVVAAIGISVFISESALLDKRIDFEGAENIYMMTVEDDYRKNGLTLADGIELSRLMQEHSAILRQARERAVMGRRS